jgi:hypothetical protein
LLFAPGFSITTQSLVGSATNRFAAAGLTSTGIRPCVPRLAKFTLDALARSFQVREDGIKFGDHRVGGFALGIVSLVRGDDCVQRGP